jgi:hypothetical protein
MKCVCGYYHLKDWQIDDKDEVFKADIKKNNGEKEFIHIKGSFTIDREYGYGIREVYLYACPECGTIQMVKD